MATQNIEVRYSSAPNRVGFEYRIDGGEAVKFYPRPEFFSVDERGMMQPFKTANIIIPGTITGKGFAEVFSCDNEWEKLPPVFGQFLGLEAH